MNGFKLLALAALAAPALAAAQVGPNPAVSGGSQDPTTGGSADTMIAPQDARTGSGPTGNVLDRSIDTTRPADDSMTTGTTTRSDTSTTDGATGTSTTTRTKSTTKPMGKASRR